MMVAHGSGVDDLLIPLAVVGAVAFSALRPRRRSEPREVPPRCAYCDAPVPAETARCPKCGFRR